MEPFCTVNLSTTVAGRPLPATPTGPACPLGIVRVSWLRGTNGTVGLNMRLFPFTCQLPGTLGLSLGVDEPFERGSEKLIEIGAVPLMPLVPLFGEIEMTLSGFVLLGVEPEGPTGDVFRRGTLWLWLTCRAGDLVTK